MRLDTITPRVLIEDGAVGWHVCVEIHAELREHEAAFDDRANARAYARGLGEGTGYAVDDRSTDLPAADGCTDGRRAIVVEQLNHAQWHAVTPDAGQSGGVDTWAHAVSDALWMGMAYELPVESVDLDGNRRLLAHAETVA